MWEQAGEELLGGECVDLVGKDLQMRQRYLRIKARRGAKRAVIAVARTLSGRIRRMLLTHEPYVAAAEAA